MNLLELDQQVFQFINQRMSSPAVDVLMAVLSTWVFWKPFALGAAVLALLFGGFKGRAFVVCAVLAIIVADAGAANAIKQFTGRLRPYQATAGVRIVRLEKVNPRFLAVAHSAVVTSSTLPPRSREGRSFPSGHVTNNFALAVVFAWFFRRFGWLYFIVAALVAWSRVYVGDHYPSDVLAAAAIGAVVGILMMILFEWLWRTCAPRFTSTLWQRHPSLARKQSSTQATR
jgi:undecaprenyl-diphosphatase